MLQPKVFIGGHFDHRFCLPPSVGASAEVTNAAFFVFYFYCPCRKTDDDDDDDDKYGVRSTPTRDSIQYAVTV